VTEQDISKELLGLEKPSSSRRGADGSHVGQKFIKIPATYIVQVSRVVTSSLCVSDNCSRWVEGAAKKADTVPSCA
jgi:hypothetical protein